MIDVFVCNVCDRDGLILTREPRVTIGVARTWCDAGTKLHEHYLSHIKWHEINTKQTRLES